MGCNFPPLSHPSSGIKKTLPQPELQMLSVLISRASVGLVGSDSKAFNTPSGGVAAHLAALIGRRGIAWNGLRRTWVFQAHPAWAKCTQEGDSSESKFIGKPTEAAMKEQRACTASSLRLRSACYSAVRLGTLWNKVSKAQNHMGLHL